MRRALAGSRVHPPLAAAAGARAPPCGSPAHLLPQVVARRHAWWGRAGVQACRGAVLSSSPVARLLRVPVASARGCWQGRTRRALRGLGRGAGGAWAARPNAALDWRARLQLRALGWLVRAGTGRANSENEARAIGAGALHASCRSQQADGSRARAVRRQVAPSRHVLFRLQRSWSPSSAEASLPVMPQAWLSGLGGIGSANAGIEGNEWPASGPGPAAQLPPSPLVAAELRPGPPRLLPCLTAPWILKQLHSDGLASKLHRGLAAERCERWQRSTVCRRPNDSSARGWPGALSGGHSLLATAARAQAAGPILPERAWLQGERAKQSTRSPASIGIAGGSVPPLSLATRFLCFVRLHRIAAVFPGIQARAQ